MDALCLEFAPQVIERCIFCGSTANGRDRGIPAWTVGHVISSRRCVCETCNGGWMSRLEQAAVPLVEPLMCDLPVTLTQDQAATIAAWGVKIAMVLERLTPDAMSAFYTDDERASLRQTWTIPLWTGVWLSRYIGEESIAVGHTVETAANGRCTGYLTTLANGHVAMQVLSLRGTNGHDRPGIVRAHAGAWARSTIRIWPTRPHVQWPPPSSIVGVTGLRTFAARWSVGQPPRYHRMPAIAHMR